MRAARIVDLGINYVHGGVMTWQGAKALGAQLCGRGTHIPMLADPGDHIADLAEEFRQSPVPVVLDHLGWPDLATGIAEPGFDALLGLVADGAV